MSNVYSGFPQSCQRRSDASVPLLDEHRDQFGGTGCVEPGSFWFCHVCGQSQISHKVIPLARMRDVLLVSAGGLQGFYFPIQTLSQASFNRCKHLSLILLFILMSFNTFPQSKPG